MEKHLLKENLKLGKNSKNLWYLNQDLFSQLSKTESLLQTGKSKNRGLPLSPAPSRRAVIILREAGCQHSSSYLTRPEAEVPF